jgi:poly-gamma-glutamate synthesis protein (capsule biosynthesis protein)
MTMIGGWVRVMGVVLAFVFGVVSQSVEPTAVRTAADTIRVAAPNELRILAVGDVNLGRTLGKKLLAGDTLFPWTNVIDTFATYDLVIANLESNLSDQHGVTEDPRSNLVFTGPPSGAISLRRAGIGCVSTANNHALDFGKAAAKQTITLLDSAGVAHSGTDTAGGYPSRPAFLERRGFRIALIACTEFMNNDKSERWKRYVCPADTGVVYPAIRSARNLVDLVILSVHGGEEYADAPTATMLEFCKGAVDAGARLVLGHHPHVPYRVVRYNGAVIAPSLGNFVFKQPSKFWTRNAYGLAVTIGRDSAGCAIASGKCLPLEADYQPRFLASGASYDRVLSRCSPDSTLRGHD